MAPEQCRHPEDRSVHRRLACGVLKWTRKGHQRLVEQLRQASQAVEDQMPAVIEMDEIHSFVQKTVPGPHMDCL